MSVENVSGMKIQVSEASGPVLDWMVGYARCLAATDGKPVLARDLMDAAVRNGMASPSTDWSQGGPIIEREEIEIVNIVHVFQGQHLRWRKSVLRPKFTFQNYTSRMAEPVEAIGPTPLVAAMRCFVASKLGDEVDVPDELT